MGYLKSALVGIAVAVPAVVCWTFARIALPVGVEMVGWRLSGADYGGGGVVAAVISGVELLAVATLAFVAGVVWHRRRVRHRIRGV